MPETSPRARAQGPRDQRKRPGDLTGVRGQQLATKRDEEKADALAAAAAVAAQERETRRHTVVDYTKGGVVEDDDVDYSIPVEAHPDHMTIRVNYPIEEMTFGKQVLEDAVFENGVCVKPAVLGRLNTYEFEEGVEYIVPWELGLHLKRLGYVYDF